MSATQDDDRAFVWRWFRTIQAQRRLSDKHARVLTTIGTYADYETGWNVYPSAQTIADLVGCGRNTVRRAISAGMAPGLSEG